MSTKTVNILYWVFTGLFAAGMLFSSWPDIVSDPQAVAMFQQMQMATYLLPFLGWAKTLGVAVILIPGLPTLKEWAYAGLFIDLTGATYCIMMSMPGMGWLGMLMFFIPGILSYYFYKKRQGMMGRQAQL